MINWLILYEPICCKAYNLSSQSTLRASDISERVGGNRSKERDRKSELVPGSTYQIFEWDRNNSDRNFGFWEKNRIAADRIF